MQEILGFGEILIDFTPSGVNEQNMALYARNPGGGVPNMLAMFAGLGGKSTFIGKVGRDVFGDFLKAQLEENGIDISFLLVDPTVLTTLAIVSLRDNGERAFSFYRKPGADIMLHEEELPIERIRQSRFFHFGGVTLTDEPIRSATLKAAATAKEAGAVVSFDCNYRPSLWNSEEEAVLYLKKALPLSDIVKVSEEELVLLTGMKGLPDGANIILATGCRAVLVSMGEDGSSVFTNTLSVHRPAYKVKALDTTGAGDAFLGAVLFRLQQTDFKDLEDLDEAAWEEMLSFGNAAGGLTTLKRGGIPALPALCDIQKLMRAEGAFKS